MSQNTKEKLPDQVLITGGTGFIGSALTRRLLGLGVRVSVLTRHPDKVRGKFGDDVTALLSL